MSSVRPRIGAGDVARVAAAVPVLLVLDVMVRLLGVRRSQQVLERLVPLRALPPDRDPAGGVEAAGAALALDRAAARVCRWSGRCLRRSLALWAWLRLRGVDAQIQLGVRRQGTALVGHAWVSHDGLAIAEPAEMLAAHVSFGEVNDPGN